MFPEQISRNDPGAISRCKDPSQWKGEDQRGDHQTIKTDAALATEVDQALWKDASFRATDFDNIDVRVSSGIVNLYGYVSSLSNQHRAEKVLQTLPGLLGVNNYLVPDDRLLAEVATALGSLENTYDCKFFTGVSRGVVLLSGTVTDTKTKLLAEKCAAENPNVRGVINSVRIEGSDLELKDQPFLQPLIDEEIFFLNGISGVVRQVIINPDNRRVIAMIIQGRFANQRQELKSLDNGEARPPERLIIISVDLIRYLTRVSGFLYINSNEKNRFLDFDSGLFNLPNADWVPPYPYCRGDVLFPIGNLSGNDQIVHQPHRYPYQLAVADQSLREELPVNDSLRG